MPSVNAASDRIGTLANGNLIITVLNVRGAEIPVSVNTGGTFIAQFNGETISDVLLSSLESRLLDLSRKAAMKISIPFDRVTLDGRVERLHATGIHQGNGALLYRDAEGKPAQLDRYTARKGFFLRPLAPAEEKHIVSLRQQMTQLQQAITDFQNAHYIDILRATHDEIARLTGEAAAAKEAR